MGKNYLTSVLFGSVLAGLATVTAFTFVKNYKKYAPKALPEKGPDGEELEAEGAEKIDVEALKKAAGDTAVAVKEQAKKAFGVAKKSAKAVGDIIMDNYSDEIDSAKKVASEKYAVVKEKASEKFAEAKEYAGEKFTQAKEYAGEKFAQAKEYAGEKFAQAKEYVQDKVESIKKKSEETEENVDDLFVEVEKEAEETLETTEEKVEGAAEEAEKKGDDFIQNL